MNGVIDAQERIDIAKSIFGGQGMKMLPLLNMGKGGSWHLIQLFQMILQTELKHLMTASQNWEKNLIS